MVLAKKTKGRQKIDIVKIQNEQNLHVTFSKRRAGLFKKASELCTLTGSEVALVIFSPAEKAYSFGSPSVNAIIERFESQTPKAFDPSKLLLEAHHKVNVQHLNKELTILENQLEAEKKIGETLNQQMKVRQIRHWWEAPIDELNLEQLKQLHLALLELQKKVKCELKKMICENTNRNPNLLGKNPYGTGLFGINSRENGANVFDLFKPKPPRTIAFAPSAGPSRVNNGFSITDGNVVSASDTSSNPNASEVGCATMPTHPFQGFNNGFVGFKLL